MAKSEVKLHCFPLLPEEHAAAFFFNLRHLIHQDKVELAVTASQIETESEAWLAFNQPLK